MSLVHASYPTTRIGRAASDVRIFWRRFRKNRGAVFGLLVFTILALAALFAETIAMHSPMEPGVGPMLTSPSKSFLMGTDNLGRDIFSGVIHGARVSLLIGLAAAATSAVIGAIVGAISGYSGGWVDDILMRGCELFQAMPRFLFALVIVVFFQNSVWNIVIVIGILSWPRTARMVRAEFLRLREMDYVLAAKAVGMTTRRIIFKQMLPNVMHIILVTGSLEIGSAILTEAGLSFLGAGDPNVMSWGRILFNAQRFLRRAWWFSVFPGSAIFLTVLSFNLLGDGLNDAFNPRLKRVQRQ